MDFGAGSGVLAVAALKLGAKAAAATDVDACAVSACRRNAQLNGVDGSLVALRCERDLQVAASHIWAAVMPIHNRAFSARGATRRAGHCSSIHSSLQQHHVYRICTCSCCSAATGYSVQRSDVSMSHAP